MEEINEKLWQSQMRAKFQGTLLENCDLIIVLVCRVFLFLSIIYFFGSCGFLLYAINIKNLSVLGNIFMYLDFALIFVFVLVVAGVWAEQPRLHAN